MGGKSEGGRKVLGGKKNSGYTVFWLDGGGFDFKLELRFLPLVVFLANGGGFRRGGSSGRGGRFGRGR